MTTNTHALAWGRPDRTLEQSRTYRFARRYLLIVAALSLAPILLLAPRDALALWFALAGVVFTGTLVLLQAKQSELLVSAVFEKSGITLRRHDFASTPQGKEEIETIEWPQVKRLGYSNSMGESLEHWVFMDYRSSAGTQDKTAQMQFDNQSAAHQFLNTLGKRFGFESSSESGSANFDLQMSTMVPIGSSH